MTKPQAHVRRLTAREFFAGGRLPLRVSRHDLTQMVSPHDHDFFEIALITRGRGEHITSRRRVLTTAGDVWFVRPGNWHTYMNVRHLGVYNCLIGPALFRSITPTLHEAPAAVELFWRGPSTQARDGCGLLRLDPRERIEAERALDALKLALEGGGEAALLEVRGRLWLFLGLLVRAAARDLGPARQRHYDEAEAGGRPEAAARAVEHLETYYAEEITPAGLAREVGLSAPHLTRLFRAMTGLPPLRYQACVRAQRACLLLAETNRSVTQVGGAVGWPDPNLFSRRFKELVGETPTEYRRKHSRNVHHEATKKVK